MHALPILKQACLKALETDSELGDPARFLSIVDLGSVLELIEIAESRITDDELLALHQVIGELCDFIGHNAPAVKAFPLIQKARQIVSKTKR